SQNGLECDPACFAISISARREFQDDWQSWVVTVTYSTEAPEEGMDFFTQWPTDLLGPQNNPWEERPVLKCSIEELQVAEPFDLDGKPFWSSAKRPLSPAPTFPDPVVVYKFTRNIQTQLFTPEFIRQFHNSVN